MWDIYYEKFLCVSLSLTLQVGLFSIHAVCAAAPARAFAAHFYGAFIFHRAHIRGKIYEPPH